MKSKDNKQKNSLLQLIVRIWTVHAVAIILYMFVLLVLIRLLGEHTSILTASVVIPIMYLVMTYLESWRVGFKDRSLVKAERSIPDKLRGVKAAFISQLPGIILGILSIVGVKSGFVTSGVRYFFMSMAYEIQNFGQHFPLWYVLPALLPVLSVIPGYALGYADKRLVNYLLYTGKTEE